jgi:hypothetical protein
MDGAGRAEPRPVVCKQDVCKLQAIPPGAITRGGNRDSGVIMWGYGGGSPCRGGCPRNVVRGRGETSPHSQ